MSSIELRQKQQRVLERLRRESVEITNRIIQGEPRIAVTGAGYDDAGSVLTKLSYFYVLVSDYDISSYDILERYQILFINCGTGGYPVGNKESLRRFVENGGVLYVSDLSAPQISAAFERFIEFSSGGEADQWVIADVVDKDLRAIVGPSVKIYFDLPDWIPIETVDQRVHIYLTGSFRTSYGYKMNRPILVSFRYGAGEVVYTSFHNHKQPTEVEEKLLKFLILKPVSTITGTPILSLAKSKGLIALDHKNLSIEEKGYNGQ